MAVEAIISSRDGEEIIHVARRYWLTMLPRMLVVAALIIAPFFFAFPLLSYRPWGSYLLLFLLGLGLFLAVRMFVQWYYTMFVVTSQRVVDVYHSGLFDRQVTDAAYDVIQDVAFRKKGVVSMVWNIGVVTIQTSSGNTMLEVRGVKSPGVVISLINEARRNSQRAEVPDARRKAVKLIETLDDDEVREVVKAANVKKRERAAEEFFRDEE